MRILVVEDEESAADFFRARLTEAGHSPLVVPGVDAACARFEAARPDAVLLSLYFYFPGLTGFDFLQREHIRESSVPVVAVSGFANESQVRESIRLGALDLIQKPVSGDFLSATVAYLAERAGDRQAETNRDRRRSPRPRRSFRVRVVGAGGVERDRTCVDLSAFGMKISPPVPEARQHVTRLHFTPPDGAPAAELLAIHVWGDSIYDSFRFIGLTEPVYQRLQPLVQEDLDLGAPAEPTESPRLEERGVKIPGTLL